MIMTTLLELCRIRRQALRIKRDFDAMRQALQCLHTLSYSDACEILEKRLDQIRREGQ